MPGLTGDLLLQYKMANAICIYPKSRKLIQQVPAFAGMTCRCVYVSLLPIITQSFCRETIIRSLLQLSLHQKRTFHVTAGIMGNSDTCLAVTFKLPSASLPSWSK